MILGYLAQALFNDDEGTITWILSIIRQGQVMGGYDIN